MQGRPEGSKEAYCPGPAEQKGPLKFIDARMMNSEYKSQMNNTSKNLGNLENCRQKLDDFMSGKIFSAPLTSNIKNIAIFWFLVKGNMINDHSGYSFCACIDLLRSGAYTR
jgi:hypothetical protein